MKTYRCKRCGSLVIQDPITDDQGRVEWWYHCQNHACGFFYGRPVYEKDLEYLGSLDPIDPGLELYEEQRKVA